MNADSGAELVLASVSLLLCWRERQDRPGLSWSIGLVALAALVGAIDYAGVVQLNPIHTLLSLIAGCAGFPLMAMSLGWPNSRIAREGVASVACIMIFGLIAVALVDIVHFTLIRQAIPALAVVTLLIRVCQLGAYRRLIGVCLLLVCFMLSALNFTLGGLSNEQQFHLLLCLSLVLLAQQFNPRLY